MNIQSLNPNKTYLVYVRGTKFISRGIQFWMRLYALRFNRVWRKPVNHADIVHKCKVWGSQKEGFIQQTQDEAWSKKAIKLFVFELDPRFSSEEIDHVLARYEYRRYDFKNFIDFIVKFFTGKWRGKKGKAAEKALYCIESVHMVMEEIGIVPILEGAWDNDPEESRQWAIDNLTFVESIDI